ncbi:MAG: PepSY domain-containing protein, partial [Pirellulaceae bacterium]
MRNRRVHYWMSMAIALPLLLVIVTGIALQLKKQIAWVQPPEQRTEVREPTVAWEQILQTVRASDGSATKDATWKQVDRIDVRPSKGISKVLMKDGWELQVDLESGRLLQRAIR